MTEPIEPMDDELKPIPSFLQDVAFSITDRETPEVEAFKQKHGYAIDGVAAVVLLERNNDEIVVGMSDRLSMAMVRGLRETADRLEAWWRPCTREGCDRPTGDPDVAVHDSEGHPICRSCAAKESEHGCRNCGSSFNPEYNGHDVYVLDTWTCKDTDHMELEHRPLCIDCWGGIGNRIPPLPKKA